MAFLALAGGALATWLYGRFGLSWALLPWGCFFGCLLAVAVIDWRTMLIPVDLVYGATAIGLVYAAVATDVSFTTSVAGFVLGWGSLKAPQVAYRHLRGREGLGDGDPPLMGLIGAFLGPDALPAALFLAASFGLLLPVAMQLSGHTRPQRLPFGPCLAAGAMLVFAGGLTVDNVLKLFM